MYGYNYSHPSYLHIHQSIGVPHAKVYNLECIFLHAILSCALVRLNIRGTLDMHHMSKLVTSAR